MNNNSMLNILRHSIINFCSEFINHPYLCYTEHGQHALFHTRLFNNLSEEQRYSTWRNSKVCVIQKEYPTHTDIEKSKRQHWDIAILKTPLKCDTLTHGEREFDHLKLFAAIEFGMNANIGHLEEDIRRLNHPDSNISNKFIVHLYRISDAKNKISRRDLSHNSKLLAENLEAVCAASKGSKIDIYFAIADNTKPECNCIWHIRNGKRKIIS